MCSNFIAVVKIWNILTCVYMLGCLISGRELEPYTVFCQENIQDGTLSTESK